VAANAYDDPRASSGRQQSPEGQLLKTSTRKRAEKSRVGLAILIGALIVVALGLGGWALFRMLNPPDR
jgi:hypothetical protein